MSSTLYILILIRVLGGHISWKVGRGGGHFHRRWQTGRAPNNRRTLPEQCYNKAHMQLPIWTPEQLGQAILIRPSTLTKWRRLGKGPRAIRIAKHVFYLTRDIEDWLELLPKAEGSPGNAARFGVNHVDSLSDV